MIVFFTSGNRNLISILRVFIHLKFEEITMTRKITKAGFFVATFLLAGCATVHPYKHVQSESDATAIVYRANKFVGGGIVGVVKVDGLAVAKFGVKKYVAIPLTPGPHVIGIHGESHSGDDYNVELNVAPQEKVYFEIEVNPKHWAWLAVPMAAGV